MECVEFVLSFIFSCLLVFNLDIPCGHALSFPVVYPLIFFFYWIKVICLLQCFLLVKNSGSIYFWYLGNKEIAPFLFGIFWREYSFLLLTQGHWLPLYFCINFLIVVGWCLWLANIYKTLVNTFFFYCTSC